MIIIHNSCEFNQIDWEDIIPMGVRYFTPQGQHGQNNFLICSLCRHAPGMLPGMHCSRTHWEREIKVTLKTAVEELQTMMRQSWLHLAGSFYSSMFHREWKGIILTFYRLKVTKFGHHPSNDRASKGYGSIPGLTSQTSLHACLQRLN